MWQQVNTKRANIILNLEYDDDFASIEVEKHEKSGVICFTLNVQVYPYIDTSLDIYKMDDLSRILKFIKEEVEYLDDNLDDMSADEEAEWKENFLRKINEY